MQAVAIRESDPYFENNPMMVDAGEAEPVVATKLSAPWVGTSGPQVDDDLHNFLERMGLSHIEPKVAEMGYVSLKELRLLTDDELFSMGFESEHTSHLRSPTMVSDFCCLQQCTRWNRPVHSLCAIHYSSLLFVCALYQSWISTSPSTPWRAVVNGSGPRSMWRTGSRSGSTLSPRSGAGAAADDGKFNKYYDESRSSDSSSSNDSAEDSEYHDDAKKKGDEFDDYDHDYDVEDLARIYSASDLTDL